MPCSFQHSIKLHTLLLLLLLSLLFLWGMSCLALVKLEELERRNIYFYLLAMLCVFYEGCAWKVNGDSALWFG